MKSIFTNLAESFSSTWTLLSDTTNFLSRVKLLEQYEKELKEWRDNLARGRNNPAMTRAIRDNVVALRRALRLQGYDLRLGSKDIALEGYRHDDAFAEGFRRVVLGIAEDDIYGLTGESNHIELAAMLEERWRGRRDGKPYSLHCLWYRWRNQVLVLSGAASETAEQFEELKAYFAKNKEFMLSKLKNL